MSNNSREERKEPQFSGLPLAVALMANIVTPQIDNPSVMTNRCWGQRLHKTERYQSNQKQKNGTDFGHQEFSNVHSTVENLSDCESKHQDYLATVAIRLYHIPV